MAKLITPTSFKTPWLGRGWNGVLFFWLGALVLCIFATIQKMLMGGIALSLRGYIMPILYGGLTGFIIGEWYLKLRYNALQIELNEERLYALINALPDIVIFKDGDGHWQDVNNVGKELFSFRADEYRGLTDLNLIEKKPVLADLLSYCHATDIEAWQRKELIHCQISSLLHQGRMKDYDLVKVPLYWQDGQRKGMVIVGRDVTEIRESEKNLVRAYDSTLEGWAKAVEMRDKMTENHTRRVTVLTEKLACLMGVPEADLVHIRRGALLHDIGKIGVPDSILNKPAALTDEERQIMVQHPLWAHGMIAHIDFLRPTLDIPYCHHEHWDGSGYPRGLKREDIPLSARIFAVVDVWDALTTDRPYRKAWTEDEALAYLEQQSGRHFDPAVVHAFMQNYAEIKLVLPPVE